MFETSQDLFYIVLSLSVLWFTVFLCWLLYQAARVLRNANRIIENLTNQLVVISDAVEFIKDKVDGVSGKMGVMSSMLASVIEKYIVGKMEKKSSLREDDFDNIDLDRVVRKKKKK